MSPRHFLDIDKYDTGTLRLILNCAHSLKKAFKSGAGSKPKLAEGAVLAMLFEKSSTRTRVSFDVAMRQLGGETIVLNHSDMQLGRRRNHLGHRAGAVALRRRDHDALHLA